MTLPASMLAVSGPVQDRLNREIDEIATIYRRLFPDLQLNLLLRDGDNPIWGAPVIHEQEMVFQPQHLGADHIGHLALPAPFVGARPVTVQIAVPRPPTPAEWANAERPWSPQRGLGRLFGLSPLSYEHIRYQVEMRRKQKSAHRHAWGSLVRGAGSSFLAAQPDMAPDMPSDTASADKRPAILIGFHWLEVGGAEKMAFDTVNWALAAGLRVFVVASVPGLQRLSERLPDHPDVRFLRLDRYLAHDRWPVYLEHLIKAENIRLIHNHHCVPLYAALAHLRVTVPWVRNIDTTHIVEYADGGYPRLSGVWSNYIDLHHVISRELMEFYRDRFHVLHKLRLGRMLNRRADAVALPPLSLQAGQKSLHVAFVGRLAYQKRPVVVVETLRALAGWARTNGVTLRATLVGEGPFRPAIERLLQRHGLADMVTLAPANSDVPALLRAADILLLPSNNEGLALVCYEAIEQGCLPISTDVGSQKEIVPPDLLIPLAPHAALRASLRIIDRLWRDAGFLATQQAALHACYTRLAADPTAQDVLMPLYRAIAQGQEI